MDGRWYTETLDAIWKPYRPGMGGQAMSRVPRSLRTPGPLKREYQHPKEGDLKTYGWVYLVVAAVLIGCVLLVLNRSQVGLWVGITAGAIGRISAIWWIPLPRRGVRRGRGRQGARPRS